MTRKTWIIALLAAGVGLAIVIGLVGEGDGGGNSQAQARLNFCSSLSELESSLGSLTDLSASSSSKTDYQTAVTDVDNAWDQVKTDAGSLADVSMSTLDSSWDSFTSAVGDVSDSASVSDALSDISQAADSLLSTTKSTLSGPDCSSS